MLRGSLREDFKERSEMSSRGRAVVEEEEMAGDGRRKRKNISTKNVLLKKTEERWRWWRFMVAGLKQQRQR